MAFTIFYYAFNTLILYQTLKHTQFITYSQLSIWWKLHWRARKRKQTNTESPLLSDLPSSLVQWINNYKTRKWRKNVTEWTLAHLLHEGDVDTKVGKVLGQIRVLHHVILGIAEHISLAFLADGAEFHRQGVLYKWKPAWQSLMFWHIIK